MTSKLTREWLQHQISAIEAVGITDSNTLAAFKLALAAMDGESVAWQIHTPETGVTYVETKQQSVENIRNGYGIKVEITPLYRHAQQPVVPDERAAFNAWNNEDNLPIAGVGAKNAAWLAWQARAMLQAQSDDDGEPTDDERIMAIEGIHNCERCGDEGWVVGEMGITRCACGQAGNSPQSTNCKTADELLACVPRNAGRSREHFISLCNEFWNWSEMDLVCADDRGYELRMEWDGKVFKHPVTQALWRMYQAATGNSPVIPGWIPVSEQMPPSYHEVLVGCWWGESPRWCSKWATYIPGHPDAQQSGWLIPGASWVPTHWQELPAAPQEPKP